MTPERFRQIEDLYHAVRAGTTDERAALFAQADPELCREVELLLSHRSGGEFLDRPAIRNAADLLEDATVTESALAPVWVPTVSNRSSARAEWEKSFGP